MLVTGLVLAGLAAGIHVYIFALESLWWTGPRGRAAFGTTPQQAEATRELAFNQGFYNLFLAIGAIIGIVLFWTGDAGTVAGIAGRTLVLFSLGSMAAAALVLVTTGAKYMRAALVQGTLPLIGFVLILFA